MIYNQLGKKDEAMKAVQDARRANPGDVGLILTEANIYIELGEKGRYQELVIEALEQDPNNAVCTSISGGQQRNRRSCEVARVL